MQVTKLLKFVLSLPAAGGIYPVSCRPNLMLLLLLPLGGRGWTGTVGLKLVALWFYQMDYTSLFKVLHISDTVSFLNKHHVLMQCWINTSDCSKTNDYELHLVYSRPLTPLYFPMLMIVCLWYAECVSLLCLRPVSSGEVKLYCRSRSCDGRRPRSLPYCCLHHRDPHRSQGTPTSLHW